MKALCIATAGLLAAQAAPAAGLYGSLVVDGHLPSREMAIELVCSAPPVRQGVVDRSGSWRIAVDGAAKDCAARVEGASTPVVVYATPTRYDLALSHPGGKPALALR